MPIVKMDRLTVVGLKSDKDAIMEAIIKLGALEIIEQPGLAEAPAPLRDDQGSLSRLEHEMNRLEKTIEWSSRIKPVKKAMFSAKRLVGVSDFQAIESREAELLEKLAQIEHNLATVSELRSQQHRLESAQVLLAPWLDLDIDLSEQGTEHVRLFLGSIDKPELLENLAAKFNEEAPETIIQTISADEAGLRCLIATWRPRVPLVMGHLRSIGFNPLPLQGEKGTPREIHDHHEKELDDIARKITGLNEENLELAAYGQDFELLHDFYAIRYDRLAAMDRLSSTESTFWLQGWIPSHLVSSVTEGLKSRFTVAVDNRKPDAGEEYPIVFNNNPLVKPYEVIIEMYGPPSSQEVDPAPVMAPFFFVFFGMMLGDVGYGAILVALCAWLIFKVKAGGELGRIARMLLLSGISSIIWGFLFGGFLGDIVSVLTGKAVVFPALWFNPMDDPIKLMIWSMVFGIIHLFSGLGIKAYMLFKSGHALDAIFDVFPIYAIIIGFGLMLGRVGGPLGQILVIAGIAVIVLFGGRDTKNPVVRIFKGLFALYSTLAGYFGDILSYARILALVMAGSVIAMVFNQLGFIAGPTVLGFLLFLLIAPIGHALNLALSTLGAYVHTSRLNYVEFFGKFYEGSGRIWRPLRLKTRYIEIERQSELNPIAQKK